MQQKKYNWITVAGPCAAESEDQIIKTAISVKKSGADIFRAGLWKPRTKPEDWQGVGARGIDWMVKAKKLANIKIATEIFDIQYFNLLSNAGFDMLWIGSRNGQNYSLLKQVGQLTKKSKLPIILKRTMSASLTEWLGAARYITANNPNVILCERGIRGYSPDTRNILDIQTAYLAKQESKLNVIVDVSHASGRVDIIIPMSLAVKASGLNGLMIEVHDNPTQAKTDKQQQINPVLFSKLIKKINKIPNQYISRKNSVLIKN